jgi:hypothetical protein
MKASMKHGKPQARGRSLHPVVVPVLLVIFWASAFASIGASGGGLGGGLGFSSDAPKVGWPQVAPLFSVVNQHLLRPFLCGDFGPAVRLHSAGFDKLTNCGVVGIVLIKSAPDVRGEHQKAGVQVEFANFLFHVGLSGLAYSNPYACTITHRLGLCQATKGPHRHNPAGQGMTHETGKAD